MVDQNKVIKNAVPVVLIILVAGLGIWLVVSVGLPFLDDPDTFEPLEVVSLEDTEDEVIINLTDQSRKGELDVLVDGTEREWNQNNTIKVNKSGSPAISMESYPENEGLFGRYEYPMGQVEYNLNYSDNIVVGESNSYTLQSSAERPPQNIEWFANGQLQQVDTMELSHTFNSAGEQEVSFEVETENITYVRTEDVRVFEPGEIALDINTTSTELVSFESFDMNITELTNKSVEEVNIDWDNGENDTVSIGETTRYWYRNPGQYNITITGESTTSAATVTEHLMINVSEREEDEEISRLNINVFDQTGDPIPNTMVSVGSVTRETDSSGFARIRLQRGEYTIGLDKSGYVPSNRTVLVTSDVVIDESLSPVIPDTPETTENETGIDIDNQQPETLNETNSSEIPLNTDFDSLTLSTFEQLKGTGTSEDPYLITNYTELQSIRVQPTANYRLTQNIDASLSLQQDLIETVENESVGRTDDRSLYLPYIDSEPEDLTIRIDGEEVDADQYQITVDESDDGRPNDRRVFVTFNEDGEPVPAEEKLNVGPSEPVLASYNVPDPAARGFRPIDAEGSVVNIEGNGYNIDNMYMNRQLEDNVGLVTNMQGGRLSNIRMTGEILGRNKVGGFVGSGRGVTLDSLNMSGVVVGKDEVGGVAGEVSGSQITQAYSSSGVFGQSEVGGIAGSITDGESQSEITESFSGTTFITPVTGYDKVGGVVGSVTDSRVTNTYTSGVVLGLIDRVGGIAGEVRGDSEVSSVYASSTIGASDSDESLDVGGIVGVNRGSSIETAYWNTDVSDDAEVGVGNNTDSGTVTEVSGLTTSEMTTDTVNSMSALNFDDVWTNRGGDGEYPQLQSEFEEYSLTITLEEEFGNEIESPIVTILDEEGEEVASESPDNSEVVEVSFDLVEGPYTIQAGSAEYSTETDIRLTGDREIGIVFGG